MRVVIDDEGHQLLQEKMVELRRERRDELGAVLFFVSGEASCRPDLNHVRMFHGGDTYGAQSMAYYSPLLKASVAVASNVEIEKPSSSPQVAYVNCLAWAALLQIEDTAHAYSIRHMCGKRPSV